MTLSVNTATAHVIDSNATTSVTLTPAANSLLVVFAAADENTGSTDETLTVAAAGLTFNLGVRHNGSPGATAEIWWANVATSASVTVNVTDNKGSVSKAVKAVYFTSSLGGIPVFGNTASGGNPANLTVTSGGNNSWAWDLGLGGTNFTTLSGHTLQEHVDIADGFDGGDATGVYSLDALAAGPGQSMVISKSAATNHLDAVSIDEPAVSQTSVPQVPWYILQDALAAQQKYAPVAVASAVVSASAQPLVQSPAFAWPYIPVASVTASQPLGNPAVPTPGPVVQSPIFTWPKIPPVSITGVPFVGLASAQPLVVSTPVMAKVPGALLFGPGAPAAVVSTVGTPSPLAVSPPFRWPYIPPVTVTASQPLGNPAVATPEPLVVGPPNVAAPIPGVRLFAAPTTIGAPAPLVSVPAFTLAPIPGAKVFAAPQAPIVVSTTATPGPLVVTPPWQPVAIPHSYLSWSVPLGSPAVASPKPMVVTPPQRWPAWTPSLVTASVVSAHSCTTLRPFTGNTGRPGSGSTAYALATTARPGSGTTARPNTGITDDPC